MDVLNRLYRLLRANVEWDPDVADGVGAGHRGAEPFAQNSRWVRDHEPTAKVDSRLAGYYANLELQYGAGADQVREAWRRLMKKYHPDLHATDPEKRQIAGQLTAELTEAYTKLSAALENKEIN